MKNYLIFLSLIISFTKVWAQNDSLLKVKVINQAEKMADFFVKNDYDSFANFNFPKIIELMGGKDKFVYELTSGVKKMEKEGFHISSAKIGEVSELIYEKNTIQCLVEQTLTIQMKKAKLVATSSLIAISYDSGQKWYFIDTSDKDMAILKSILPEISALLVLPPKSEPVFISE